MSLSKSLVAIEELHFRPTLKTENRDSVAALRGGVLVLLVGGFEQFLKDAFVEHLKRLTTSPPRLTFDHLSEKMVLNNVKRSLLLATKGRPWDPKPSNSELIDRIKLACTAIGAETIDPEAFANTGANPNPETVKDMFRSIGIERVFESLTDRYNSQRGRRAVGIYLHDKLGDLIEKRNLVAHAVEIPSITKSDLDEYVSFVERLAKSIDVELQEFVQNILDAHS